MMKLTVAFLAALAAADAAEARTHRQARRQYGDGYGYGGGNSGYGGGGYGGAVSSPAAVSSAKPVETPSPSSKVEVPYIQSSAEAFKTSQPAGAASSYPSVPEAATSSSILVPAQTPVASPSKPAGGNYGEGYPAVPAVSSSAAVPVVSSSAKVPEAATSSVGYGAGYPAASSSVKVPAGGVSSGVPSGVVPSSGVPSGVYPSGGAGVPVSSKVPSPSSVGKPSGGNGYPAYPTGTAPAPAKSTPVEMTTKTIYSTQIVPASSGLVTKTVPVGTTVCPKEEATKTPSPSAPASSAGVVTSQYPVSEITKKVTETLVYTVGVGSTAHPVTTEVVSTATSTIYSTVVITIGKSTPAPGQQTAYPEGSPVPEGPTTTIKSTSTTTKYITVKPTPSGKVPVGETGTPGTPGAPAGGAGKPSGGAGECAPPVTVTVTAKETVTVTKGQEKPTPGAEKPGSGYPTTPQESGKPSKPAGGAGKPTPSPLYPIGNNGTYPAGPTGFKTSTKPAVPVGTGVYGSDVPSKPSSTASLPNFSFASEVPVKTPSQETGAPKPTPSAAYPPAGGEGYPAGPVPSSAKPVETPKSPSAPAVPSSKVPSNQTSQPAAYPTPTPAGNGYGSNNGYGSGYGTY